VILDGDRCNAVTIGHQPTPLHQRGIDQEIQMTNIPITSRRSVLAGIAAAATPITPALATALGGLPAQAACAGDDPIFAAIAEHRAAQEAVTAAFDRDREEDEDEVTKAAQTRQMDAQFALFTTAPTTIDGAADLLAYLGTDAGDNRDETIWAFAADFGDEELVMAVKVFPLQLAATLRTMIEQQTRIGQQTELDPIFTAIERHRAAWNEHNDRCSALDAVGTPEAEAENDRLIDVLGEAEDDMRETAPATITGAVAFLHYVAAHEKTGLPLTATFNAALLADALAKIGARS
jgi:hypothetical protein